MGGLRPRQLAQQTQGLLSRTGRPDGVSPPIGGGRTQPPFPQLRRPAAGGGTAPVLQSQPMIQGDRRAPLASPAIRPPQPSAPAPGGGLPQIQVQPPIAGGGGGGFTQTGIPGGGGPQIQPAIGGGLTPPPGQPPIPPPQIQPTLQPPGTTGPTIGGPTGAQPGIPQPQIQPPIGDPRTGLPGVGGPTIGGPTGAQPPIGGGGGFVGGGGFTQGGPTFGGPGGPTIGGPTGPIGGGGLPGQPGTQGGLTLGGNPLVPEGQGAVPLGAIGGLLERQLANPSRFGSAQVQQAFTSLDQQLQDQANQANQAAIADAQRRGVFFGTPLTTSQGDIATQLQRGRGDLATNLLLSQAQTGAGDLQRAIQNVFQFGGQQQQADQFAAQLGLQTLGLGLEGAPSIGGAAAQFGGAPQFGGGQQQPFIDPATAASVFGQAFAQPTIERPRKIGR